MGKAPLINKKEKLKILKQCPDIFNRDGSLKKASHPAWDDACKKMVKLEKPSIYLDVFQNRNTLKTDLLNYFIAKGHVQLKVDNLRQVQVKKSDRNVDMPQDSQVMEKENEKHKNDIAELEAIISLHENVELNGSSMTSYDSHVSDSEERDKETLNDFCFETSKRDPNPQNFPAFSFTITLNEDEWRVIKPVHFKLPKYEWTPIIAKKIYDNTQLRCGYMFQVGTIYRVFSDKYIDFHGYCGQNDCQTYIYGVCKKKPTNDKDGITFEISTYDTTSLYHSIKRPFTSTRRKEAGKKLVYMSAEHYGNEMVQDMMSFSEKQERPDIPSGANLRRVKAEGLRNYLGISGPKDPIKCLVYMMDEFDFLKEVCLKPFRVWYWFPNQVTLWDESEPLNAVLKLDATGSLIKKVSIDEDPSAYIYLYQLLTTIDNNYAPLSQMISSRHDTNAINHWLNAWKRETKVSPTGFVCDDGLALLYGSCESFNDCSYKLYMAACVQILQGNRDVPPLKCHMGLDRAHITKLPSNWKSVKAMNDKTFTDFVTRSIALASVCETLDQVKNVMLATFVVLESKSITENSMCDEKYDWLMDQFENFGLNCDSEEKDRGKEYDNEEELVTDLDNSEQEVKLYMECNTVKDLVQSIYNEAMALIRLENEVVVTDDNKNPFYCRTIKDNLFFLYSQFPAWTNTMRAYFHSSIKVATSGDLEAYFKDLRNTYNLKHILGAHTFVMYHARIIDGQVKIAHCALMKLLNGENNNTVGPDCSKLQADLTSLMQEIEQVTKVEAIQCQLVKTNTKVTGENNENAQVFEKAAKADLQLSTSEKNKELRSNNVAARIPSQNETKYHSHVKNGDIEEAVEINERQVKFTNTCAYDSIMALFSFGYEHSTTFKNYVDGKVTENEEKNNKTKEKVTDNGLFFGSIAGYSNGTMNMKQFYLNRGLLLLDLHNDKTLCSYNCVWNVNALISTLLKNEFCCGRVVRCYACGHRRLDKFRSLSVQDTDVENFINSSSNNVMRDCIMSLFNDEWLYCRSCRNPGETAIGTASLGFFLVIETDRVFENHGLPKTNADIPSTLTVHGATYTLSGFIIRIDGGVGHYIAFCYDSTEDQYEVRNDYNNSSYFCKRLPQDLNITTMIYVIAKN